MKEKNCEAVFIPCGDSMEKMEEISEKELEAVSGGKATDRDGDPIMSGSMLR